MTIPEQRCSCNGITALRCNRRMCRASLPSASFSALTMSPPAGPRFHVLALTATRQGGISHGERSALVSCFILQIEDEEAVRQV